MPKKPTQPKPKPLRILGLDLSLSPGIAAIEVRNRQPHLIAADSVATSSGDPDAVRSAVVESFVSQFVYAHRPFDVVVREDFTAGRNKRATQTVFSAWTSADRALYPFGYVALDIDDPPKLAPTYVKKTVTEILGKANGKAEKDEVAKAVRKWLRLPDDYPFRKGYDDSDACAVILAYLIRENLIDMEVAA
ncbi:crossover junction endodeoxyribonuclease RuvC [Paenibacillus sp. VCA1]|uniref:crossover junction endodeoxyribonuclease RuvC n=1 Tax=Paenibacillus sp. VCA1 TaxID=3039148 RepID=UPI00287231E3|nr:crossover junction endodeoxyribonuclease RuvC [Paenibacillus sp. VCA1]MDR9852936.1 crossover junction endodeoxyribonuclease RuvC [Paenibacillus sp. VCA1]